MRIFQTMMLGAVALGGLAACGQSDEAFRASYRTKALASCNRGGQTAPNPGNVDVNRLCTCVVDGYMRSTPTDRLRAEGDQSTPPAAAQQAMMQCAQELMPAAPPMLPAELPSAPASPRHIACEATKRGPIMRAQRRP